jgi:hypothetical protein
MYIIDATSRCHHEAEGRGIGFVLFGCLTRRPSLTPFGPQRTSPWRALFGVDPTQLQHNEHLYKTPSGVPNVA